MRIRNLLENITYSLVQGNIDEDITEIIYDSRKVSNGCMFVCIKGSKTDGHNFVQEALEKGAKVILTEKIILADESITVIRTENSREALAKISMNYYLEPQKKLCMIGITGTKGKTTTAVMIKKMLEENGEKVGLIGTIGAMINEEKVETENTTPESYELFRLLHEMVEKGCKYCVMEVSSQGLKQNRVKGIQFQYGIFTNFSTDHIGPTEHTWMDEYLFCKSLLFKQCDIGIINVDDFAYPKLILNATCKIFKYGTQPDADLYFSDLKQIVDTEYIGQRFLLQGCLNETIQLGMPGEFNVYNSMAALSLSYLLKLDIKKSIRSLAHISVPGRVEYISVSNDYHVIIDYAHNEGEVKSLLEMVNKLHPSRIICVFGSGGNRTKARRYSIGELCGKYAELSILSMDNPRDEKVADINKDIILGMKKSNGTYVEIEDRKDAIYYALDQARKGDYVLLIGKGHEDYQEILGIKHAFSEHEILREYRMEKSKQVS